MNEIIKRWRERRLKKWAMQIAAKACYDEDLCKLAESVYEWIKRK